jgi:indolepyruvate ferredoxin oxidoreductase
VRGESAHIVVNSDVVPTAQFQSNQNIDLSQGRLLDVLAKRVPRERIMPVPATSSAVRVMGDSIATNIFMLGFTVQKGLMPIGLEAIEQAIRLNGVAIDENLHALNWGRLAAHDPARFGKLLAQATGGEAGVEPISQTLGEIIDRRLQHLTAYQDAAYADRYLKFVDKVREVEYARVPGSTAITQAVALSLSKLMSYKDEYEVARFYTNGDFLRRLREQFDGEYKLSFHLSPPILNPRDKATGRPRKVAFGPWMLSAFKLLAKLKGLRGTAFDVFGYTAERRMERQLVEDYRKTIESVLPVLSRENAELVAKIAALPDMIKGYGYVKDDNFAKYQAELQRLLASFDDVGQVKAA